ncbi:unnamed protein product, partial [Iphiclides podalirius]
MHPPAKTGRIAQYTHRVGYIRGTMRGCRAGQASPTSARLSRQRPSPSHPPAAVSPSLTDPQRLRPFSGEFLVVAKTSRAFVGLCTPGPTRRSKNADGAKTARFFLPPALFAMSASDVFRQLTAAISLSVRLMTRGGDKCVPLAR